MAWLDDERYIRVAGALLLASPFFNFFLSVATNNSIPDKWSAQQLWMIFMSATALQWILRGSKIVVGYLMFRGKSSAWVPVLAILGVTIFLNFYTFKKDVMVSQAQAVMSIVINVILFLIVFRAEFRLNQEVDRKLVEARKAKQALAAQAEKAVKAVPLQMPTFAKAKEKAKEEFKNQPEVSANVVSLDFKKTVKTAPEPKPLIKPKKVEEFVIPRGAMIEFEAQGAFAKIIHCEGDEVWLQTTGPYPKDIHRRSVMLDSADRKRSVRLKYNRHEGEQILIFKVG